MSLTEKELEEYNELIGKFMNMKTGLTYRLFGENLNLTVVDRTRTFCYSHELRFHKDWNWLISVINKITSDDSYPKYKDNTSSMIDDGGVYINTKFIDVTYNNVVDFINWYNERTN